MKMKRQFRSFVAYICAIALIIAGMAGYQASAVAAEEAGEQTTEEQTPEVTTSEDANVEWQDAVISNSEWTDLGAWQYVFKESNSSQAQITGGDQVDNFGVKVENSANRYAGMLAKTTINTEVGKEYNFSMKVSSSTTSENGPGKISVYEYAKDPWEEDMYYYKSISTSFYNMSLVDGGDLEVTGTFTAEAAETTIIVFLNSVEPGTTLFIKELKLELPPETEPIPGAPETVPEGYTLFPSNTDPWTPAGSTGAWEMYAGTWSAEEYAYVSTKNGEDPYNLSINFTKTTGNNGWLVQLRVKFEDLDIGERYAFELKDGENVLYRRVFYATTPSYQSDNISIGENAEGTTLNLVATCNVYDDSEISSVLPGKYTFETVMDSKYNVLLDAEYTQSSEYAAENTPNALTNASVVTGYMCTAWGETNQEVIFTVKKEQPVSKLCAAIIDFKNDMTLADTYKISISADGENYEEIGSYTTNKNDQTTFNGTVVAVDASNVTFEKYKYVKLTLDGANGYGYQVTEFGLISSEPKEVETTTPKPTTKAPDPTTKAPDPTTKAPDPTTEPVVTTPVETTKASVVNVGKTKVKKASKKKSAKKIKLTLKKVKSAVGYQIKVYKTKKNAKKNKKAIYKKFVKKAKVTIKSKKLKNKKKLFVRARAYVLDAKGNKIYGKWSIVKQVQIRK